MNKSNPEQEILRLAAKLAEAKAALTKAEAVISYCPTCSNALEKSKQTKRKAKP